jgi:hypothetical protein
MNFKRKIISGRILGLLGVAGLIYAATKASPKVTHSTATPSNNSNVDSEPIVGNS